MTVEQPHVRSLGEAIYEDSWLSNLFKYSSPISKYSESKHIVNAFKCSHMAKMVHGATKSGHIIKTSYFYRETRTEPAKPYIGTIPTLWEKH